jgi:hypothetical protein
MRLKILTSLIHNNQIERVSYARSAITDLVSKVCSNGENIEMKLIEISYQPKVTPCSVLVSLYRDAMQRSLGQGWNKYTKANNGAIWSLGTFLKATIIRYVLNKPVRRAWQWRSTVEIFLASKHIRAWEVFLESDADYLLVFEDDIVFKSDSVMRFCDKVIPAVKLLERAIYVDLAGGCTKEDLRINALEIKRNGDTVYYAKPVTNTTCSYLIDKNMARYFVSKLVEQPSLRLIGVDWLTNKLFILMGDGAENCSCIHFNPTIFDHGSVTGSYLSSIRKSDDFQTKTKAINCF